MARPILHVNETLHEHYFGRDHVTVIEARKGWRMLDLKELWAYRELLQMLTLRDIQVRYKQTVLGFAWAIIQPTMLMIVFSIFFGRLAKIPSDGLPYPIFVYAGLLPWNYFANAVSQSGNSVVSSARLVSKVYFPRLIIPVASVCGGLVDFAIATSLLLLMMLYYSVGWSLNLLLVPILLLGVVFTAIGVGTLLSALTVAYRDFRYVVPFLVQFWMFATPVVYPASLVPGKWQWLLYLNPMAGLIEGFRSAFLDRPFNFGALALSLVVAALIFIAGVAYFEKVERRFADIV
jgi:lipopolysaccharide transport system permease protein